MSSQMNRSPELNRADTSEAPVTGEDRFAKAPVQLQELLERGEISLEAFAVYSATADAALPSTRRQQHRSRQPPPLAAPRSS